MPGSSTKSCGECTMCCGLPVTPNAWGDPWCDHCEPGVGCGIYDNRPSACKDYLCLWMTTPGMTLDQRPEQTKVVLWRDKGTATLYAYAHPLWPEAYKHDRTITEWLATGLKVILMDTSGRRQRL